MPVFFFVIVQYQLGFCHITLPSRPQHPRILLPSSEWRFWCREFVSTQSCSTLKCTTWGHFFLCGVMAFSHYVMFIHNEFIFQEESLPPFLSCRMRLNNRSELVLIIFYLHLINSGYADSSMADKKHGKLSSWRMSSRGAFQFTIWLVWNKLAASKTLLWRR